ncbi:uncharacterized protein HMPREF1541_08685 [Cyphellophora europaea CBS 101466]|uniref:Arginase n=1 Tax=Cyphellophora europaea (strain CBS 101466) TaxID=1220924 RepID=W2RL40_CYPE1|nr:uncharacterized protein HMPREF1541_08685 [Cyphellophora europaea CBS 101466]ETN36408.1 hypothetical protein HMPREF1541_08685 [Cyphellophora europaea CBS 101466]
MAASFSVDITYVPADCGSVIFGKSKAPDAFKSVNTAAHLRSVGCDSVAEHEALSAPANWRSTTFDPGSVRNESLNVEVCNKVRDALANNLSAAPERPPFQLILGGECCMLPGILSAFWSYYASLGKRVGLVYIDADTDLHSPADASSTGNLGAQTLTHLADAPGGLKSMKEFSRPDGRPLCDASNTVLFGLNMTAPINRREHFAYLYEKHYRVVPSLSVAANPVHQATQALSYLEEQGMDIILVHLDVDAIDPGEFPLANLPNYTGVQFEEMMKALEVLMAHKKTSALSVAEVNPDHDPGLSMTRMLSDELVRILGRRHK